MSLRVKQAISIGTSFLVAAVMVFLGLWQMSRFQLSVEEIARDRAAQPVVALAPAVKADGTIDDIYGRCVVATGHFLPEHQVLVGSEPQRVVTLFQIFDGRYLAVVRGVVPPSGAIPPASTRDRTIVGVFTASDHSGEGEFSSLHLPSLAQRWPSPLIAGYITLDALSAQEQHLKPAKPGLPAQHGTAMHQGYALQWWVFAVATIAFGIFTSRQLAIREKARAMKIAELQAQTSALSED